VLVVVWYGVMALLWLPEKHADTSQLSVMKYLMYKLDMQLVLLRMHAEKWTPSADTCTVLELQESKHAIANCCCNLANIQ